MNKSPDTILHNGKIYTVDKNRTISSAVAIAGDTILAVGSDAEIMALATPSSNIIDLKGKLVLPGLNDSHAHPFFMAQQINDVSFTDAKCIQDCLDLLKEKAQTTALGEWIKVQMAWHETQLQEGRPPTRDEIDSVCPNNPVSISRGSHIKICNSMALELAGIKDDTPSPDGGLISLDENGRPNGLLLGKAAILLDAVMPRLGAQEFADALIQVAHRFHSYGVTTTAESGIFIPGTEIIQFEFETLVNLYTENKLPIRMATCFYAADYDTAEFGVKHFGKSSIPDYYKFEGIKLMQDGGIEGANLIEPYEIVDRLQLDPDYHGVTAWPAARWDEFRKIMQLCADNNLQLQVHTNGDKSAIENIGLFEEQAQKTDIGKLNWTLCHLPLATDEQLEKIKKYGICVTVQHQPYLLGINARRYWGVKRADSQANYRALFDKGIRMGGGTDLPIGPMNPFLSIQFMVDRKIIDGSVMGPDFALTLEEVIYIWTQGSADCEGWGDMIGSIEAGKKADMAVLNQDIFSIPTDEIHNTTAAATWLGGKCVYQQS
jgi:hypothetical protein